ncbi:hypothetical protein HDU98_000671 [Podochytrium sp. JEL0797]|nr:hypothetical protein HDU98_000671 [Podochytrium sp. JEL0797]
MNEDASQQALLISKRKFEAREHAAALKFAEKSIRLCETSEGLVWLEFLRSQPAQPEQDEQPQQKRSDASEAPPKPKEKREEMEAPPARPFTPAQEAGIKRIRAMKAKGDLYGILGLEKSASDAEVKKAYRKLALQFHPDKCGAPGTDEAFKAINHSWTVLSDVGNKEQYDRYGVDPTASGRGGGGGGGAANPFARHAFHGHPGFQEVNPEDIFNMFFGGEMGGGGGGGNGFHFQFGGNPRFRQQQQRQRQNQQQQQRPAGFLPQLFQAAPILILMFISFLSTFTNPSDPSLNENSYSWDLGGGYTSKRATDVHNVDYYVNPKMFKDRYEKTQYSWKLKNFEKSIEAQYYRNIYYRCQQEKEYKQQLISSAYSLFRGVDENRLKLAQTYDMKNCQEVEAWNSVTTTNQHAKKIQNAEGKAPGARKRAGKA